MYLHQPVKDKSTSARQHRLYLAALEGTLIDRRYRLYRPTKEQCSSSDWQSKAVSAYQGQGEDASLAGSDPLFNGSLVQTRDVLFAKSHQASH
ncbi:hypothetical protein PCASD_21406 [Puccinia coronata f. sp. avenae]|uniref:Uncharacterized protein n=1 Tax=Puccinia coronata f. sp. avenae TaxID=200324 RepID=A0A2N5TYI1_9BASI|nr:hypothetical protein PCASD_24486 [Puccinia coronata f. sp. avenae]PLW30560.1 hypothetical protein PCASD_21406 [Puccinia coronata f. sp. avenae]